MRTNELFFVTVPIANGYHSLSTVTEIVHGDYFDAPAIAESKAIREGYIIDYDRAITVDLD